MIWFVVVVYFIVMLGIGVHSFVNVKSQEDFYAAGKKGGTLAIAGSLLASILGGSAILGSVNLAGKQGWAAAWLMVSAGVGLFVLYTFADKVKNLGRYTLPEMIGEFYGKESEFISSIIIVISWIGIIAAQVMAASTVISYFLPISYKSGLVISGVVFIVYTLLGGQVSIIKTDVFQSVLMITGVIVVAGFALFKMDNSAMSLKGLNFPFNEHFTPINLFILLLTYSTTYIVGPDIYSRIFCAKDTQTAKRAVLISAVVLVVLGFVLAFIGVYGVAHFPSDIGTHYMLVYAVDHLLPSWAVGLLIAGLLSAVLSSADTTLLTASTILSEIFVKIGSKSSVMLTRIFIVLMGALSVGIIFIFDVKSIVTVLLISLAAFSGAFIIPTFAGIFGYRTDKFLSISALIFGGIIALYGKLVSLYGSKITFGFITDMTSSFGSDNAGSMIIIFAFIVNAIILFFPRKTFINLEN